MATITKVQQAIIDNIEYLYSMQLSQYVTPAKRNYFNIDVSDMNDNDFNNIQRYCNDHGHRMEPNGYKRWALMVK